MKLQEILAEAISLTQHEDEFRAAVLRGCTQASKWLTHSFKDMNGASLTELTKKYKQLLPKALKECIGEEFSKIASPMVDKIINPTGSSRSRLPVDFEDIGTNKGDAYNHIRLSNKYIDRLATDMGEMAYSMVIDNLQDESEVHDDFVRTISSDRSIKDMLEYSHSYSTIVDELTSTMTHELTHILQHYPQFKKGRGLEYRSYLDKKKGEFNSIHNATEAGGSYSPEWHKLYVASPQEMAARSQQTALEIIRANGLSNIQRMSQMVNDNEILSQIPSYLDDAYPNATTPKDQWIRNRYAKQIYQEVKRYLDQLREKLKKREDDSY